MFTTVLLDVDGTLLDFDASEREALHKAFQKCGYPYNSEVLQKYTSINIDLWKRFEQGIIDKDTVINTRFVKLFETFKIEGDGLAFEEIYQDYLGEGHDMIQGADEFLEYLYQKYELYIVTNGVTRTQRRRLKESGIDQYMKDFFISEQMGSKKPDKEYFDFCFEKIGITDLSRVIIIGDSLSSDIKGGNNAGIATCWYNPNGLSNQAGVHVDYEIRDFNEIKQFL